MPLELLMEVDGPRIDKSDAAGAIRRMEIRSWLRCLPDAKRNALVALPQELDPEIASAITETVADLSGVSEEQCDRLRTRALYAQHPDTVATIREIDAASDALADTIRYARSVFEKAGVVSTDHDAATGAPTMREKIAARLGEDEETAG